MTEADNPLLTWTDHPPFDRIAVADIEPAVTTVLAECETALAALEERATPEWSTIEAIERIGDRLDRVWGPVTHLMAVQSSDELRAAHDRVQPAIVAFGNRFGQSRPLYEALRDLRDGAAWDSLEEAQQRIVESLLRRAVHAGVGLDDPVRERFNQIRTRLAELSTAFSNHVLDATKAWHLDLTDPAQVAGMPVTWRSMAAAAAREAHPAADAEQGPWRLGLDFASVGPFLQHCRDRDLRETAYRALIARAANGELDNGPLIEEILALRQELAALLDYDSYADYSLVAKMAPSVAAVREQLADLRQAAWPAAQREFQALQDCARAGGQTEALGNWDVAFWSERLREQELDLSDEELRPYFAFDRVLTALFDIVRELFDVEVRAADGAVPVWHEDVRYFTLHDSDGGQIAACYLDPFSRPADKRGGAWMNVCVGRSRVMGEDGVRLPVAYLACNQTPPVDDTPSLMTFREVETLFHEFGHALQHMLTTVDHGLAAGIQNVEWDAVELPSQFMEYWCLHRPLLADLAKHYQTGEPMPAAWIERLQRMTSFLAGLATCRQLLFAITDLDLHETYEPAADRQAQTVYRAVAEDLSVLPPLPEDRFLCSFGHIFAGGYAAGYYSYKWAEILSADAFAAFEEAGLDDAEAVRDTGRRFRDTVLACGGGRHPMQVFEDFRGRPPSPAALLRHLGLSAA